MKTRTRIISALAGALALLVSLPASGANFAPPHKVHVSVTNLEFNRKSGNLELSVRVFTDDLENALSRSAGRRISIDPATMSKTPELADLAASYLSRALEIRNRQGRLLKLAWDGIEGQADVYWLYLQARQPAGIEGLQLRNRIFFELFDDQVNIVNARNGSRRVGIMFESRDGFKPIP